MMRKLNKKNKIIIAFLILTILITVYFFGVVLDLINTLCAEEAKAKVINLVNESNDILLSKKFFYQDYFKIIRDNNNEITTIMANTGLINQLNMIMQTEMQNKLNTLRNFYVAMPIGAFTGSALLAQFGFDIYLKVQTINNCYTEIISEFSSIGINHTIHRLIIRAVIDIEVLVPTKSFTDRVINDVIMAETIIVGKVPDTYIGGSFDTNYLDLMP